MAKKVNIPIIPQISTLTEGKSILIVWGSLMDIYPQLVRYNIYKKDNEKWVLLENMRFRNNQFLDTNVQIGKEYFCKKVKEGLIA